MAALAVAGGLAACSSTAELPPQEARVISPADALIVPREVGEWLHRHLAHSTLKVIDNVGHCPHLSAPTASSVAMETFLARTLRYAAPM